MIPGLHRQMPAFGPLLDKTITIRKISVMQTTLRIDDDIYRRAKAKSSELGVSLTRFFEEAVEERLTRLEQPYPTQWVSLPVSSVSGSVLDQEELHLRIKNADLFDDLHKLSQDGPSRQ